MWPLLRALSRGPCAQAGKTEGNGGGGSAGQILNVVENGRKIPLDTAQLLALIESSCAGLGEGVNATLDT